MSDRRFASSTSWVRFWVVLTMVVSAGILLASEAQIGIAPLGDLGSAHIRPGTPTLPGHQHMYCVLHPKAAVCKGASIVETTPNFVLVIAVICAALMLLLVVMLRRKRRSVADADHSSDIPASPRRRSRRSPTDPKEAILAAVANLEEHLESIGVKRNASESTTVFLTRVLPRNSWSSREGSELVRLYWTARFSDHILAPTDAAAAEHYVRLLTAATMPPAIATESPPLPGRSN